MKKWTPAQLKLLVDKTIEEIIANPFEQGRCFLHNTVEFVLNHDPEVMQLVPSISNITYNILRQRGFIEAFDKAWAEYHGPGNKVDVHIHINSSPEAMPLDQLLDLVNRRIEAECKKVETPIEAAFARPSLRGLVVNTSQHKNKHRIALVLASEKFRVNVALLQKRVEDVLLLDLITTQTHLTVNSNTQMVLMLDRDPAATIASIGAHLQRNLKDTDIRVDRLVNYRALEERVIEYAGSLRKRLHLTGTAG